ncbi:MULTISPECIES: hypothetical protein [unclassified Shewanella]|uniref:hypothetical protein n=1 Tax=unclassified Shewanella TaxID=196818 RepID=UPI000C845F66|nr:MULTISPECIES: hypothetical protein [unclassified Shewanella]MDO6619817.1 hypothetical protein [Shewanella sp. 6_MG-2023]MDO6638946.1 hypothetical protein [Shewanella sp. 5_MG-2023]MDO6676969.1 hypothetical protein [Shewanella sp. 4_MG-2023]MDO6774020.1 hypothetical protein [Shewanella sp. 3_MG-2023]PMG27620.1 hypothetical protein BCU94_04465 [Shewanella sp. 10N.286.52.C2]
MLTKILVTLLVIVACVLYIRSGRGTKKKPALVSMGSDSSPLFSKLIIYPMIAVSMLVTAAFWGWSWYDDNKIVQVTISSPVEAMSATYYVRKKDIEAQRITTVDGIQIRLSNQERITVAAPTTK